MIKTFSMLVFGFTISFAMAFAFAQTNSVPTFKSSEELAQWYKTKREQIVARQMVVQKYTDELYYGAGNTANEKKSPYNHGLEWEWQEMGKMESRLSEINNDLDKEVTDRNYSKMKDLTAEAEKIRINYKELNNKVNAPGGPKEKLTNFNKEIKDLKAELRKLEAAEQQSKLDLNGRLAKAEANVAYLTLESDVTNATNRMNDVTRGYEALANKYDNKMIKVYLWQKFNNLLNSDAFCKAKNSCSGDKAPTAKQNFDLNEVFPNVKGSKRYNEQNSAVSKGPK